MADVSMKDFLTQYFRQAVFNSMPAEQFNQLKDWLVADTLTNGMKDWKKWNLVVQDANNKWVKNEIMPGQMAQPATASAPATPASDVTMTDKEWEKLFKNFLHAFQNMAANTSKFKDNKDANEYLDKYFGSDGQIFGHAQASPIGDAQIAILENILADHSLRQHVERALRSGGYWNVLGDDDTVDDFLKDVQDKKYNKNPKAQEKVISALTVLEQYTTVDQTSGAYTYPFASYGIDLSDKDNWFKFDITPEKMTRFRLQYGNMLSTLANKDKVYNVFKDYGGKITEHLDKARTDVNFKDGDNRVPPKRTDDYNYWDKFTKQVKDKITPYTDKWTKLRGGHVYNIPQAKVIVDASAKANFHPKDGLKKFLENADKIKAEAIKKDPSVGKTVGWMIDTLKDIQSTTPKAFEGALKSGHLMRHVANAIMLKAAQEDKVKEAKATLEALSVLRYGYMTSNTMDALRKEDISIFSDKNLSWNKHEGMRVVSKSVDYTIKAAFVVTGYSIAAARHWVSNRRLKNSKQAYQKEVAKLGGKNNTARQNIQADIEEYTNLRDATSARLTQEWQTAGFADEPTYTQYLEAEVTRTNGLLTPITDRINNSTSGLRKQLQDWINANPRNATNASDVVAAQMFMHRLQSGMAMPPVPAIADPALLTLLQDINVAHGQLQTATTNHTDATKKRDNFKAGKNAVSKYDEKITQLNDGLDNLDTEQTKRLEELQLFWNFLQAGSATRTGNWFYEKLGNTKTQNKNNQEKKTYTINGESKEMTRAEYKFWQYQQKYGMVA